MIPDVPPTYRVVESTAYCDHGTMADGTATRTGSVAMNGVRMHTRIRVNRSPTGLRLHTVRDRIGYGSQLDFWVSSCGTARQWGRRRVIVRFA